MQQEERLSTTTKKNKSWPASCFTSFTSFLPASSYEKNIPSRPSGRTLEPRRAGLPPERRKRRPLGIHHQRKHLRGWLEQYGAACGLSHRRGRASFSSALIFQWRDNLRLVPE